MSTTMSALWRQEHGDDYDVPEIITSVEGISDMSWHNDTCPKFGIVVDDVEVVIWCEHPDPERWEAAYDRFQVYGMDWNDTGILEEAEIPTAVGGDDIFCTGDPGAAVEMFLIYVVRLHAARRARGVQS